MRLPHEAHPEPTCQYIRLALVDTTTYSGAALAKARAAAVIAYAHVSVCELSYTPLGGAWLCGLPPGGPARQATGGHIACGIDRVTDTPAATCSREYRTMALNYSGSRPWAEFCSLAGMVSGFATGGHQELSSLFLSLDGCQHARAASYSLLRQSLIPINYRYRCEIPSALQLIPKQSIVTGCLCGSCLVLGTVVESDGDLAFALRSGNCYALTWSKLD